MFEEVTWFSTLLITLSCIFSPHYNYWPFLNPKLQFDWSINSQPLYQPIRDRFCKKQWGMTTFEEDTCFIVDFSLHYLNPQPHMDQSIYSWPQCKPSNDRFCKKHQDMTIFEEITLFLPCDLNYHVFYSHITSSAFP